MIEFFLSNASLKSALLKVFYLVVLIVFARIVEAYDNTIFLKLLIIPGVLFIGSLLWFVLPMLKIYKLAHEQTKDCNTEKDKAVALFRWVVNNIEYDYKFLGSLAKENPEEYEKLKKQGVDIDKYLNHRPSESYNYFDVCETFYGKKGICGQQAYLLDTLFKAVGLKSYVVDVSKDCNSKEVEHACVCLEIDGSKILIDTVYKRFGIMHQTTAKM